MRVRFVLSETVINLRRNLSMTFAVVLTVAISLGFVGAAALLNAQVSETKSYYYGNIELSVFLKGDVTQPQRDDIRTVLTQLPQVQRVYYESKDSAYQRAQQLFADQPELLRNISRDALPESFRVKLYDPHKYAEVASAVQTLPGVDLVQDAQKLLGPIFRAADTLQTVSFVVAVVAVAVAILLIFNTVRLAAFSRRRETGIMRLVGASDLYIQAPFVLEGAVATFAGALGGLALLAVVKWKMIDGALRTLAGHTTPLVGWGDVFFTAAWLTVVGIAFAAIVSALTLQRYLRV